MIDPTRHQQLMELDTVELCTQILYDARNELYMNMHFLDISLSSLRFEASAGRGIGTDGETIYYNPEYLFWLYKRGRSYVNRAYLHMVFHCLFCHTFPPDFGEEKLTGELSTSAGKEDPPGELPLNAGEGDQTGDLPLNISVEDPLADTGELKARDYWNLACDIAMESVIDGLNQKCVHKPQSPFRRETYLRLGKEIKVLTAEAIYRALRNMKLTKKQFNRLAAEFYVDDHDRWYEDENRKKAQPRQNKWNDNREKMQTAMESLASESSDDSNSLREQVQVENRERYDYKKFLRKFSVLREELQVDEDSFDYTYYTYGLSLYGNMPIIEPLETKEIYRIEDFVIVIDTSMSCSGELVRRFLEETYAVLRESETYFKKINIHIIQCDDKIQSDHVITSQSEMDEYMKEFTIIGKGGTDFRPAFEYVNRLRELGTFRKLRGLLYFTDGEGIYPVKRPVYDTAFVFMKDQYTDLSVPGWAIKLILEPEDIEMEKSHEY